MCVRCCRREVGFNWSGCSGGCSRLPHLGREREREKEERRRRKRKPGTRQLDPMCVVNFFHPCGRCGVGPLPVALSPVRKRACFPGSRAVDSYLQAHNCEGPEGPWTFDSVSPCCHNGPTDAAPVHTVWESTTALRPHVRWWPSFDMTMTDGIWFFGGGLDSYKNAARVGP